MIYIVDSEQGYDCSPYLQRWKELGELLTQNNLPARYLPLTYGRKTTQYAQKHANDVVALSNVVSNTIIQIAQPGDKVLFTQGWKVPQYVLWYLNTMMELDITTFVTWYNEPNITYSELWGHFWGRDKSYSPVAYNMAATVNSTDVNIYASQSDKNRNNEKITSLTYKNAVICKPPTIDQVRNYNDNYSDIPKKDRIIVPYKNTPYSNFTLLKSFALDLQEKYEVILCDYSKLTRQQYYEYLAGSKIMFCGNVFGNSLYEVYEALSFGVFPLVPLRTGFDVVPQQFTFPREYIKANKYIRVVRSRDYLYRLFDQVKDTLSVPELHQHAHQFYGDNFETQKFIQILKNNGS